MLPHGAKMDQGAKAMKRYTALPKTPALLEPNNQIICVIFRRSIGRALSLLQRCSRCILQPEPTWQVVSYLVVLNNTNNYVLSRNDFYLIIVICAKTVIWFQIANHNPSSSSCYAIGTNIHDSFSPPFSVIRCFQQVFRTTSCIGTELL